MVIIRTRALDVSIQAVSPLSIFGGAGVATAGAAAAGVAAAGAPGVGAASVAAGGAPGGAAVWACAAPPTIMKAAAPATKVRPNQFIMLFIVSFPDPLFCVQSASLSVSPVRIRTT